MKKKNKAVIGVSIGLAFFILASLAFFFLHAQREASGPATSFDWDAQIERTDYQTTYVESQTGSSLVMDDDSGKEAFEQLETAKKAISDPKVLKALELVDAVYIDQSQIQKLVKAADSKNQKAMYGKMWQYWIDSFNKDQTDKVKEDYVFTYQQTDYPMQTYGPMYFRLNSNALGQAGAYSLEDYKVEGNTVYLKLGVASVDTYQYYVKASYKPNFQSFFEPLAALTQDTQNLQKRMSAKLIYYLAALDFDAKNFVDLYGMSYLESSTLYLALTVDEKNNVNIDDSNLAALLQIAVSEATEANQSKFETTEK